MTIHKISICRFERKKIMERKLKFKDLSRIVRENSYVALRDFNGQLHGVNCRAAILGETRTIFDPNANSGFVSYIPLNIAEYITCKSPYS